MNKDSVFNSGDAKKRFFEQDHNGLKNSPSIVELKNISHSYSNLNALRGINFNIKTGDFIFLTGASGAGKTTLLRIISGDLKPTIGSVESSKSSLFVTQIYQDLKLIDNFTILDNLKLANDQHVYGSEREFFQTLHEMAKVFGIYDSLNRKISNVNGGLKQKVAIMRALLPSPDILVADEPTSALDFENSKKLFDVLSYYNSKKNLTVIWASHNRELVRKFGGKMAHMEKGILVYSGHACFI